MARAKYIPVEINQLSFSSDIDSNSGLLLVNNVIAKEEAGLFNDPYDGETETKSIFTAGEFADENGFYNIWTNSAYGYALASALIKKANDELNSRVQDEKSAAEKEERIPELDKVMNAWKESILNNDKLIVKKLVMTPATRFYSGKQGTEIASLAKLDSLDNESLLAIVDSCQKLKGESSNEVRSTFNKDNPWLTQREDYTSEGWRQRELLKFKTLHELGLLTDKEYKNKKSWAEEFDFYPGWNYESTENVDNQVKRDIKLNNKAIDVVLEFNKYFCINAINKDKLWNGTIQ